MTTETTNTTTEASTETTTAPKQTLNERTLNRIAYHQNLADKQQAELAALETAGKTESKGFARKAASLQKNLDLITKLTQQLEARIEKAAAKPANDVAPAASVEENVAQAS